MSRGIGVGWLDGGVNVSVDGGRDGNRKRRMKESRDGWMVGG